MASRIARVTVSVDDLAASLALYRDVLGLAELYTANDVAMLTTDPGDRTGAETQVLLHRRTPTPGDAGVAISFGVTDVDAATTAAVAAGAVLVDAPADQPWRERQAVLRDRDGHLLCLVSPLG
ncbi:VOC family protein [Leifsonia sp. LS1]|uniref:VOC family protein n=1 Tax=Leifsonia sp. LS1 TaxID=2828483 RepID=UPI001CFD7546|nr:VOC family protein [Leifsonia sp. LS1]